MPHKSIHKVNKNKRGARIVWLRLTLQHNQISIETKPKQKKKSTKRTLMNMREIRVLISLPVLLQDFQ